jgi:hypothetical protein
MLQRCSDYWKVVMSAHRSSQWYAGSDRNAYIHLAWIRRGLPAHACDGWPYARADSADLDWSDRVTTRVSHESH